ncbi:oligosaccharide flippase family protein [Vibrio vulnificus]|nr:oligosaccharide flippase family protein [Vibrio vulnificus]ELS3556114.1 oligosaccharide flippase family protein [Vibrio vulnificus]ELS9098781.1 oligosaccharide flippase family protein [Vibrio vulnificus]
MNSNLLKYVGSNLIIKAFVFLSQILVAFFITAEELGEVKTAQAFIEVLSILACIGLNASILATAPKLRMLCERQELYSKVVTQTTINSILVIAIMVITISVFSTTGEFNSLILVLLLPLILFTAITTQLVSFLQCEKKFDTLAKGQLVAKLLSIPILISITYGFGLNGYIAALYITSIITIAVMYNKFEFKIKPSLFERKSFKEQWGIAQGALFSNVLGTCGFYAGLFITNIVVSEPNMLGNYSFALIVISGFEVVSRSIQQYYIPHFSENRESNIKCLEAKYLKISTIIAFPILSVVVLIAYVYPQFKYSDSLLPLSILVISWVFSFKYILKAGFFVASGNTMLNFQASILNLIMTAILSVALGYIWGIVGVSMARLFTSVALVSMYERLYKNVSN